MPQTERGARAFAYCDMNPLLAFWLLFRASLFSTGGMGNFPILHADYLERGWATEGDFAESLAVGQLSPGPNGLWVISLGFFTDGLRGAILAAFAITLPTLLVIPFERFYQHVQNHKLVDGFLRGLNLCSSGIFGYVLLRLFFSFGADLASILITLGAILLGSQKRIPFFLIPLLAALVGIILYS